MFKQFRVLAFTGLFIWSLIPITAQDIYSPEALKHKVIENNQQLKDLINDVSDLKRETTALNIQQRLTTVENNTLVINGQLSRVIDWQDKFQWALIALLGEALLRVASTIKSHFGEERITHESKT